MRVVRSKLVQQGLLAALLFFIFYDGIWGGAPRADHLGYLHNMWGQNSLGDIVSGAPAWHREHSNGDFFLFRPLLYLQLGLFYHFFGYEFALWQLAGLVLHVAIVLILHGCFWQTSLRGTFWPFLLALPLAVSQFGAELVLWTHLGGYLLFVLTALASFRLLICYARTQHLWCGIASLLSAFVCTFLYETGTLVCILIATWLLARACTRRPTAGETGKRHDLPLAGGFLLAAVICPLWGVIDYGLRYGHLSPNLEGGTSSSALASFFQASWYALLQIAHWLSAFLLPNQFLFSTVSRMVGRAAPWWPISPLQGAVYVAALMVIFGAALVFGARLLRQGREFYFSVTLSAVLLYGYSWVIAMGRGITRGLDYVFYNNLYYAHIAYAAAAAMICVALLFWRDDVPLGTPSRGVSWLKSKRSLSLGAASLAVGLLAISAVNADGVAGAAARYRNHYAPDLLEIVEALRDWHGRNMGKPDAYFVLGPGCRGNEVLEWFDSLLVQPGKGWAPPVTFADALFPERSYALNNARLAAAAIAPQTVECVTEHLANDDLLGKWRGRHGARFKFSLGPDGKLAVTGRSGTVSVSTANGRVEIPAWSLSGRLARTGTSLLWDDGSAWRVDRSLF